MDFGVGQDYSRFSGIFDGKFCAAPFSSKSPNRSGLMVALQRFHILDFERFDEKIVESKQGQGIVHFEAIHESLQQLVNV